MGEEMLQNVVFCAYCGYCIHELIAAVVTCTNQHNMKPSKNSCLNVGGALLRRKTWSYW